MVGALAQEVGDLCFTRFFSLGRFKLSSFALKLYPGAHVHSPPPFLLKYCYDSERSAVL